MRGKRRPQLHGSREVQIVLPRLGANTQNTYKSIIKQIRQYFDKAPLDQIRPMHIKGFDELRAIPTTANRCKRVFSTIWNHARAWGYTDPPNPCEGIKRFALEKRLVYITDNIFELVYEHASEPLRDAMDLADLTGQRPGDALKLTERDIDGKFLVIKQSKTSKSLCIEVIGKFADLIERIRARKRLKPIVTAALLVNTHGKWVTGPALRYQFDRARDATGAARPELADQVRAFSGSTTCERRPRTIRRKCAGSRRPATCWDTKTCRRRSGTTFAGGR